MIDELDIDIPEEFIDPISQYLMKNPVVMPDGYTYSERSIFRIMIECFELVGENDKLEIYFKSPLTRERIVHQPIEDQQLKSSIEELQKDNNLKEPPEDTFSETLNVIKDEKRCIISISEKDSFSKL